MRLKLVLFGLLALAIALVLPDLKHKSKARADIDPGFQQYISGFTNGSISRSSTIQIVLTNDYPHTLVPNEEVAEEVFSFDPEIKGKAIWKDNRTIEFIPEKPLTNGQDYNATFHLNKILKVTDDFENFNFGFYVIKQDFEHSVEGFRPHDKKDLRWQKLNGLLYTADLADPEALEKMVSAVQNDRKLSLSWSHEPDGKVHHYTIDSIERVEARSLVTIRCKADEIGASEYREFKVDIPSLSDFTIISVKVEQSPEQYVSVQFSDPLSGSQDLNGLISIGNLQNLRLVSEENELKIYPASRESGKETLTIEQGLKNIFGFTLKQQFTSEVIFEEILPAVKFSGKGVILPNSTNLTLPFEAVNLKAVDVTVVKIYENNIPQFLQVNDIDGTDELTRVGKIMYKRRIPLRLNNQHDYSKWNRFSIDLSGMIRTEPGAIYHVKIGFRKEYSLYDCAENENNSERFEPLTELNLLDPDKEESTNRYSWYSDDEYYDEDYNWSERENPCNGSYYIYNDRSISRNVFASDLGIIAKAGNNGSMLFAVTDILTAQPLAGTTVQVFDFQHQKMIELTTDAEGIATCTLKKKPFMLMASKGKEKGYLKLEDGSSLSLSQFDVSGESIQKGLKGMIYGERGVWRPGDSLFLTFILEDKNHKLPDHHPVTFELTDPQGQLIKKITSTNGVNGFFNFSTKTEPEAKTGNYTAKVKVGGTTFTKNIKIETIMPNRLKILMDFPSTVLSAKKGKEHAKLQANWLHGAPGRNLKTDVSVTLSPSSTSFTKYKAFVFDDPARKVSSEPKLVFEGRTDEAGKTTIPVDLGLAENAPGMLKASFTTRVFEEGGAFSIDRFTVPYSPFETYVGVKLPEGRKPDGLLYNDKTYTINVVTVDEKGQPVSGKKLKAEIYKVRWHWWWQRDNDDLADFIGQTTNEAIYSTELESRDGNASFLFKPEMNSWGRYYVRVTDVEGGHQTGGTMYIDWPEWAGRSRVGDETGATMLSFTSNKAVYTTGENIQVNIPTGATGRLLITAENGSGILKSFWVNAKKGMTTFDIPATKEMSPNIFIYATYIQPHTQTQNDMPVRMYGVIPVRVEDPETHLKPVINMATVLVPETNASITVKEEKGKEMTYTLAVVDEGLLDLTRFKTPDAWNHFYAREALGVKTWDLFEDVMGAYGAKLERLLKIGGDAEMKGKAEAKANRFKPMVKFIGPYHLKKGEAKTHTFKMPQYVGSVRAMVVAGDNGAYGLAEKTVPVRKPLMILATMPRVVSAGEKVSVPVSVFAMENSVRNVSLSIETNDLFTVESSSRQNLEFASVGDKVTEFNLTVKKRQGLGKVKVVATSGKERSEFPIEIDVRIPNPRVTEVFETIIDKGKSATLPFAAVGLPGTNTGVMELSVMPPINLESRLKYLIHYPYGCIEQTTSSAFPQLALNKLMQLDDPTKKRINANVKATLQRLRGFQLASGGFAYWPGNATADEWGTSYAGHFILVAEKNGYAVPAVIKEAWIKFQKQTAQSWRGHYYYNSDLMQAYRLYTLALARQPEMGAMNRLRENKNLTLAARWKLAGAYALAGQPEAAKALIKNASFKVEKYNELGYTFGSNVRDEAMILQVLTLLDDKVKAANVARDISKTLSSEQWYSTQETSYMLLAMADYAGEGATSGLQYSYSLNGSAVQSGSSQSPLAQIKFEEKDLKKGSAVIQNKSNAPLYVRVIMEGIPESGNETDTENNLSIDVRYTDLKGNSIKPDKLTQGTDLVAEVTVKHPGVNRRYEQLALAQLFPSGWEIHNARFYDEEGKKRPIMDYQDIRDDRVYTYFSLSPGETKVFKIQLNAAYLGSFYLPAVTCEAMYDHSIYAREKGRWIQVGKGDQIN